MPFKYIGRTNDFKGKTLWEIVGNLKNYGVGRIVTRSRMERYPEPCYYKIIKVETLPEPETYSLDNLRKTRVWVEKTWRGNIIPKPILIESASYKNDYRLIPKDEEEIYCRKVSADNVKILPKYTKFPPLVEELIRRETPNCKEEDLRLEIAYNKSSKKSKYRIAEDGEKVDIEITPRLGKPVSPQLYEGTGAV